VRGSIRGQGAKNDLKHAVGIPEHIVVPESKNFIVMVDEPSLSPGITLVGRMLSAIDLNH
jgi:hypothetical protein